MSNQVSLQQYTDKVESPFWAFDLKSNRYRDKSSGRFLSQQNLERLQKKHITLITKDIDAIGELLIKRQINLKTFQEAVARSLKTLHLAQAALGKGGVKQMTSSSYLTVGRELRKQYAYLKQFAIDINRGYSLNEKGIQVPMTEARFRTRLSLYARAGRVSYEQGRQEVALSQDKHYMQRILGNSEHCGDCLGYAARGVQPVGTLPLPGQACTCGGNCRCSIRYFSSHAQAIASTKIV